MATSNAFRLEQTPYGFVVAVVDRSATRPHFWRSQILMVPMMMVGYIESWLAFGIVIALLLGSALVLPNIIVTHFQITPRTLTVRRVRLRKTLSYTDAEQFLTGRDGSNLLGRSTPSLVIPWTTVTDLGWSTEEGIWVEHDGERLAWTFDPLEPTDIADLHAIMERLWQRSREHLTDTAEDASQARRALQQLKASCPTAPEGLRR